MFSKPLLLSIGAGGAAIAAVVASANSIGTVDAKDLGAGVGVVATCDDTVGVDYTTAYDGTAKAYVVTAVKLTGVAAACAGQSIRVTLTNTNGDSLGEASGTMPAAPATASDDLAVPGTVKAADVARAAIVISE